MIHSIPSAPLRGLPQVSGPAASGPSVPAAPPNTTRGEVTDRVDLSEAATVVARLTGTPPERLAKILAIKRDIDRGEYLTEARLHEALSRMIEALARRA